MMKDDRQLDDLFRSKLGDFEMKPPVYLWDGIQEKQAVAKRKKRMLVWWISGTAASLLIAFLLGWELQKGQLYPADKLPMASQQLISEDEEADGDRGKKELMFSIPDENEVIIKEEQRSDSESTMSEPDNNRQINYLAKDDEKKILADSERARDIQIGMLKSIMARFKWKEQHADQLDAVNISEKRLSDEDLRIIAANRARLGEEKKKAGGMSWKVGAMVTPVLNVNEARYTQQYAASLGSSGAARDVSLGGGLTVEMQTPSRWSIQSGIQYNRIAQGNSGSLSRNLVADAAPAGDYVAADRMQNGRLVVNGPAGQVVLNSASQSNLYSLDFESAEGLSSMLMTRTEFDQVFDYVEIPLLLRYQLLDHVVGLQFLAGLNSGFLVRNAVYSSGANIGHTADMNEFTLSSSFGFGLGYKVSPNLQIRVEPQFRYYLQSLNNNSNVEYKPYSFGVSTGVSYSF